MTDNTTPANFLDDVHQRITQAASAAGWEHLTNTPEKMAAHDKLADQMAATLFGRISPLDDDVEAKALAKSTFELHRFYVESEALLGETLIGEHGGLQFDWSDPTTMNRPYAILHNDPRVLLPLSPEWTWKDVADKYLSRYFTCDIDVSIQCERTNATDVLALKHSEFVCLYKHCAACLAWFADADREQFRTREFFTDWDRMRKDNY